MLPDRTHIDANGRLAIPAKVRRKLNLKPGDEVFINCNNNQLTVSTFTANLEKARSLVAKYTDKSQSLVDELTEMRKEDALAEKKSL